MKKAYLAFSIVILALLSCAYPNVGEPAVSTPAPRPPSHTPSPAPIEPELMLPRPDPVNVSTSKDGNHVNTITILEKNQWVLMAGTGGTLSPENQEIGKGGKKCYIAVFWGPSAVEHAVEIFGDDYFLVVEDYRPYMDGSDPEILIQFYRNLYDNEIYDFCAEGIEVYRFDKPE